MLTIARLLQCSLSFVVCTKRDLASQISGTMQKRDILFMLLQGANGPQHIGHVVLGQILARLPLPASLLSLLPLWLLTRPCLRCCTLPSCCIALH